MTMREDLDAALEDVETLEQVRRIVHNDELKIAARISRIQALVGLEYDDDEDEDEEE